MAKKLGVTRQHLHRIVAERAPVTPEMALRFGAFCGNGAGLWLRMQQAYDLRHAERAMKAEIAKRPTAKVKAWPVSCMKRSATRSCARLGQLRGVTKIA